MRVGLPSHMRWSLYMVCSTGHRSIQCQIDVGVVQMDPPFVIRISRREPKLVTLCDWQAWHLNNYNTHGRMGSSVNLKRTDHSAPLQLPIRLRGRYSVLLNGRTAIKRTLDRHSNGSEVFTISL